MLTRRLITAACAAAMLTAVSAAPARAQGPMDQRTEFTFNQPVELPGVTLPARHVHFPVRRRDHR